MVVILMGPMGSGKTTVGVLLAQRLGWRFCDADSYHSGESIAKMKAGIPLSDEDRMPWLRSLREKIDASVGRGENIVLACSALKGFYREMLGIDDSVVRLFYLKGSYEQLKSRVQHRKHPYMAASLLKSQFESLEEPGRGVWIDVSIPVEAVVAAIMRELEKP